jgi:2-dehydro-3-deoxyphosphooctonate aldolase (KDO 8-P synthase)
MEERLIMIGDVAIGDGRPLALIAGPCVIESRDGCLAIAEVARDICAKVGVPYIFKASFDKANRTSVDSYRGPGIEEGLRILEDVRAAIGVPVLSDVHWPEQCAIAAEVLDILQIPAFLARQTDLVVAAGKTGKPVNVKKAQFMAPSDMAPVCEKIRSTGNHQIALTDRGTAFGYNRLVSDMRSIPRMQALGCPVIFDATHSVQEPGGQGTHSGGERDMVETLSLAAIAAGADALFLETHPDPDNGLCDIATMLPLSQLAPLLSKAAAIRQVVG